MNMMSIGKANFKGCQRSKIMSRTLDSLNDRLPIKMVKEKIQRKRYFFHENDSRFFPQVIRKSVFS